MDKKLLRKEKLISQLIGRSPREPLEVYDACKQIDGCPDADGTFPIMGHRVVKFYQYYDPQLFYEPITTYDDLLAAMKLSAHLAEAGVPKHYHNFLQVGFKVFKSAYRAPKGRLRLPRPGEKAIGDHIVSLTGWDEDGEALHFINSWGETWGDNGFGLLTRSYLEQYMTEAWLMRNVQVGPNPTTYELLMSASDNAQFAKVWMRKNRIWRVPWQHAGVEHEIVLYETLSMSGEAVEVIEILNPLGLRVGWTHLHRIPASKPQTSVLKELFVWPAFRRNGYGRKLEAIARYRASVWKNKRLQILLHEADAFPSIKAAGEAFARRTGYTLSYGEWSRPSLRAIAEKTL